MAKIGNPYAYFVDIDGEALEAGYIYIGQAGLDPQTNPVQVYSDKELTVVLEQPIRTIAGAPVRSGSPTELFTEENGYSITTRNKNGTLVQTNLDASSELFIASNLSFATVDDLIAGTSLNGGSTVNFSQFLGQTVGTVDYYADKEGGGAVYVIKTASQAALDGDVIDGYGNHALTGGQVAILQPRTLKILGTQYGIRAESTDETDRVLAAKDYAVTSGILNILFPSGTIGLTEFIELNGTCFEGQGVDKTIFKCISTGSNDVQTPFRAGAASPYSQIKNFTLDGDVVNRVANGDITTARAAIQIKDTTGCVFENIAIQDFGNVDPTDIEARGTVFTMQATDADCYGNTARKITIRDFNGQSSFGFRFFTDFSSAEEWDDLPYYVRDNLVDDCELYGTSKNAVELVGPNTIRNTFRDCTLFDARGFGGFETDFGARYNEFVRCRVIGYNPHPQIDSGGFSFPAFRTGFGFPDGGNTGSPTKGTRFADCTAADIDSPYNQVTRGFYLLGSTEDELINPSVRNVKYNNGATESDAVVIDFSCDLLSITNPSVVDMGRFLVNSGQTGNTFSNISVTGGAVKTTSDCYRSFNTADTKQNVSFVNVNMESLTQNNLNVTTEDNLTVVGCTLKAALRCIETLGSGGAPVLWKVQNNYMDLAASTETAALNLATDVTCMRSGNVVVGKNMTTGSASQARSVQDNNLRTDSRDGLSPANLWGSAAPTTGTWNQGDRVWDSTPSAAGKMGWVCVTTGTPGTWKQFGDIDP